MIIKRTESEGQIKDLYDSSNILASYYDENNDELTIIFRRGAKYVYKDVKKTDFVRFETSESQGKALNEIIKPYYEYERKEDIEPSTIEEEIREAHEEERHNLQQTIVDLSKKLIAEYEDNSDFSYEMLMLLDENIQEIKKYYKTN